MALSRRRRLFEDADALPVGRFQMARNAECVFCKIVSVDIPASVVYEDDAVLCFLDISPLP